MFKRVFVRIFALLVFLGACWVNAAYTQLPTVTFAVVGEGSISSSSTYVENAGETISVMAYPDKGYGFWRWSTSSNCKINTGVAYRDAKVIVNGNCIVTATFIDEYRVIYYWYKYLDGGTADGPTTGYSVKFGKSLEIETPDFEGFHFIGWKTTDASRIGEKGVVCSISDPTQRKITVESEATCYIIAYYGEYVSVELTAGKGGSVSPSGSQKTYAHADLPIKAVPDAGYRFSKWTFENSQCRPQNYLSASTTLTVKASCELTANFQKTYTLTTAATVGGSVSSNSSTNVVDAGGTISIYARAGSDYRFDKWESSSKSCVVDNPALTSTKVTLNDDCTVKAIFVRLYEVTMSSNVGAADTFVFESETGVVSAPEKEGFKFAYWRVVSGEENCALDHNDVPSTGIKFTGNCSLYAHYAPDPAYKVTEEFVKYDYVKNHQGLYDGSIRFMLEPSDEKWYRVDFYTRLPRFQEFAVHYFDKGSFDSIPIYWISVTHWDTITTFIPASASGSYFTISHNESNLHYCDHEVSVRAELVPSYPLEIVAGDGGYIGEYELYRMYKTLPVGAYIPYMAVPYLGYMPDSWDVLEGGCSVQYAWNYDYYALMNDGKCSIRMNFTDDTTIVPVLKINSLDESRLPGLCADVSVGVDGQDGTIWYIDSSRFVVSIGGDTVAASYDTVWREGLQSYVLCFDPTDKIFNGDDYEIKVGVNFAGKFAADSIEWVEPKWREKDTEDSVSIVVASGSGDVVRATDKFKVVVNTQNFADDVVDPIPSLNVVVACAVSGDEESVTAAHVDGGKYESAAIAKREGAAVRGDGVLDCAAKDSVVARFVDPVYGGETRTAVGFEDVVKNEYQFVQVGGAAGNAAGVESVADLDSVETMNAEFGFRVKAVSPTLYKADTIMVLLLTDAGDSVWTTAVETGAYTGEFVGRGSFSFVVDAESNHVVIYAQVDGDKSELNSRDSLVVYYDLIPATLAELLDKDLDGRADFVRVRFARSIVNKDLGIDLAKDVEISADGLWIEGSLDEPFEYGVTDLASAPVTQVKISKRDGNFPQKIALKDRVGAVPVSAVKHPGKLSEEDYVNGKVELPPDTLVVTMSEPVDSAAANLFAYTAGSAAGSAAKSGFVKFGKASADKSRKVWTLVLARSVDIHVGDTLRTNPDASTFDKAGNAPGIGGVTVTGEEGEVYLYAVKAHPPVVKAGNRARLKVETRKPYKCNVTIFDNVGNFIAQFSGRSKFEDVNADNATQVSFIEWDQYTDDGRLAGTGVYIWKIQFVFDDGHREWRTIKTGIKR